MRVIGLLADPSTRLFRVFRAREETQAPSRAAAETSFDDY